MFSRESCYLFSSWSLPFERAIHGNIFTGIASGQWEKFSNPLSSFLKYPIFILRIRTPISPEEYMSIFLIEMPEKRAHMYSWIHSTCIRILIDDLCFEFKNLRILSEWFFIDTIPRLSRLRSRIESNEFIIRISPDTSRSIDIWILWEARYDIIL